VRWTAPGCVVGAISSSAMLVSMDAADRLPRLAGRPFITDGGLETTLVFHDGIDLPCFAAFDLLKDEQGRETIRTYFEPYIALAREHGVGIVVDTATWRANRDWGERLGYSPDTLDAANRAAVSLSEELREAHEDEGTPIVVNGCIGPRGDGYVAGEQMTADEARRYHAAQIATLADAGADMVAGVTMTYAEEAVGIVRAARTAGIPVAISFTVETDGRLPSGQALGDAIEQVDADTDRGAAYFMINCAHPTHFEHVLEEGGPWLERIGGLRANASTRSHAELDESEELDEGDPADLGARYGALRARLPNVSVVGGCCGTDLRHIEAICKAWLGAVSAEGERGTAES
jgi:S-methylmethionine-dependent homocysteine/selenocysteine methylase